MFNEDDSATTATQILQTPPIPAATFFARSREYFPAQTSQIDLIEGYYNAKLYHQLCGEAIRFVTPITNQLQLVNFLHSVLTPVREKFNAVSYLEVVDICAQRLDPKEALILADHVAQWYSSEDDDSFLVLQLTRANVLIRCTDLPGASNILFGKIINILARRISVDIRISAAFHKACLLYFKALDNPQEFYTSAQLYLAYVPIASIPEEERNELGVQLCVAALRAPSFFDFGEIRANPILKDLDTSTCDTSWVTKLIDLACSGDLNAYTKEFLPEYGDRMEALFGTDSKLVDQKIRLSALVSLCTSHAAKAQPVNFHTVVERCGIPIDSVEIFIILSMSMGLIRGQIDGLERKIYITWVLPRLGEANRADDLRERFNYWASTVQQLATRLEDATSDQSVRAKIES